MLKINFKVLWKKFRQLMKSNRGEIKAERYVKELLIDGVVFRLISMFEGKKDIDKTLERLAVKNALAVKDEPKSAS